MHKVDKERPRPPLFHDRQCENLATDYVKGRRASKTPMTLEQYMVMVSAFGQLAITK